MLAGFTNASSLVNYRPIRPTGLAVKFKETSLSFPSDICYLIHSILRLETPHAENQSAQVQPQPQPQSQPQPQPQPMQVDEVAHQITASNTLHPQVLHPPALPTVDLVHAQSHFQYPMFDPALHDVTHTPQHTWHTTQSIAPQQAHIVPPPQTHIVHRPSYRDTGWDTYDQTTHTSDQLVGTSTATYDYRYREDQTHWVGESFYNATVNSYYYPVCV